MTDRSEITVQNLIKAYKGRNVVNGVSLDIKQGEVVGLLGPNGAGKTTTFYMIVGLVKPASGRILLDGMDITSMPMYQRARHGIGYLAQEASIFRKLTVAENLRLVLEMNGVPRKKRDSRIDEILTDLRIDSVRDRKGYMLSGGERRRAEIARALAVDPKFMLLDEPFTGVDPLAITDIQEIVLDLKSRGIGVIITDHNVRETLAITDRTYILSEGQIRTSGISSELHNDPVAIHFYFGDKLATSMSAEACRDSVNDDDQAGSHRS